MPKIFLIYLTFLFPICVSSQEKDYLMFEKEVAYEIFPALMDSLHQDTRVLPPPPPFKKDKDGNVKIDSVAAEKGWQEYEKRKKEFYRDTVKLVTAVEDSASILKKEHRDRLLEHFKDLNLELDTNDISTKYRLNLNRLKADPKIVFKYLSEFPYGREKWKKEYDFYLNGTTGISRIQFDKSRKYGILISGYATGMLSGGAYFVYIKKEGDKWIIDEMVLFQIS